ncbi:MULTISPECIES: response regulator transcription factor [unclassified Tolypothrix]|uniref:response regulator transcription factor n=1 Tax=unclassified Tolypothrix TaxID=2649714 RepID=UPI0005EAC232|nr:MULTISPECIES: response regulator transcription factor [unclassified Tolypothrix]BAY90633.1 two component transcriptional regulator, winged helix family protein [Microchaete diplosiphon NIES-3275]EKF01198.1 response regulator [Tolypothrix sp. PCC 7601]MBE9087115.1 response regulator transcription factor [Tolypothrix sp. LEGE 11397]UYD24786.1 response regulator transcription factor [Tolypothrix sp. PCC 7712]UYD32982.1 response regulator transcription factor [Tolypothrix sp. PCC 7601]
MDILIVEDEIEIAQLIQLSLEKEGFICRISRDGINALRMFQEQPPDLIILDLMLPGLDGLEVCARIRQKPGAKDPYILMLTAKGEEIDRVIGLSTGADDYMVKPFSPRELVARVRALLRRSLRQGGQNQVNRSQHFIVDIDQRTASRQLDDHAPEVLDLTTLEFNLLSTFVSNPGRVWNRTQLIDKLWGDNFFGDERVVDTHIARLRKKIEPDPANPTFIKTVVGVGYKFDDSTTT